MEADDPLLGDLAVEYTALDSFLLSLPISDWRLPTPAEGWDVLQTVVHLTASERAVLASLRDDQDPLDGVADRAARAREKGAAGPPATPAAQLGVREVLEEWQAVRTASLDAFSRHKPSDRVPWGGRRMTARSLATARLMETWAHGLDCFAAVGVQPLDTNRLIHVAWLGWATLPHAFATAGLPPPAPPNQLRVELIGPDGASWNFGPEAAASWVRGRAGVWCRVVTQRWRGPLPPPLEAHGVLAESALTVARAFL